MRPRLVVMVKAPQAGRVKTRLGAEIGMVRAAWWARHRIHRLTRTASDPRWDTLLAVAPDAALTARTLPNVDRIAQDTGDLGARMVRVANALSPGPVLIVGTDIPDITRAHIAEGFALLGAQDAVFGPATDGGYWALGFKHTGQIPRSLFAGVRWSTKHALSDSLACVPDWKTALLPRLTDIDTQSDFSRVSP